MPADPLPADVLAALKNGSTIEAIKLLRETSGLGLKEARDAIDRHQRGDPARELAAAKPSSLPPDVVAAMQRGEKIEAIRLLRERTGIGLKEAKDAVEALQGHGSAGADLLAPGEVAKPGKGAWIVAAIVALAIAAYAFFGRSG